MINFQGPAGMMVGYLLFGFVPPLVKVSRDYGWLVGHTLLARFGFALLAVALILPLARKIKPVNWRLLLWRGVFGGAAVLCYFTAIQYLGAGKGTLLNYTHSIFANLFGAMFLARHPAKIFWLYLAGALLGLWLVIDPNFHTFAWPEALGLLSGMLGGCAILCVKELRETDNALTIFSALTIGGLLSIIPAVIFESDNADLWTLTALRLEPLGWLALVGLALLSMLGQLGFTHGYKGTSVQFGTVMSLTTPLVAALTGWLFLDEILSSNIIIGGILILFSSFMTALTENKKIIDPNLI